MYLNSNLALKEFVFLQEIHPSVIDELSWSMDSKENYYFHMVKYPCAVAIGFCGSKTIPITNSTDHSDQILLVQTKLNGTVFILININQYLYC